MIISQPARDARKKVQMARLAAAEAHEVDEHGDPTYPRMYAAQPTQIARKAVYDAERATFRVAKYAVQDAIIAAAGGDVAAFDTGGAMATASAGAMASSEGEGA